MKIYTKSLLSICVCLIVLNCTYSPSGNNFNEIEIPEPSSVSFNWLDLEGDTLNFIDRLNINIKVETESENYYRSELLIDSVLVKNFSNTNISYRIEQADYPAGIHEIQLLSYFKTESGSLAEQLHSEYYVATKNWFFKIDNTPCSPVSITDWTVTDEGLIVNWEKYKHSNFYGYILYRQYVGNTNQYAIDNIAFVNKIDSTHALVNDIPGGEYEYKIRLACFMPEHRWVDADWTSIDAGGIELNYQTVSDGNLMVSWNKPPIQTKFSEYHVYVSLDNLLSGNIDYLNIIEDTTYALPIYMGSTVNYKIIAFSKSRNSVSSNWLTYTQKNSFAKLPYDTELFKMENNSNLFYTSGANLYEIDKTTGNPISSHSFYQNPIVGAEHIFDVAKSPFEANPAIVQFSKTNYAEIDRIYSNELFSDSSIIHSILPSYNSSKILVKTASPEKDSPTVHYVDYETKKVLKSIPLSNLEDNIAISANGKYFIQKYRFYTFFSDSNIHEQRTEPEAGTFVFDSHRNDFYYNINKASSCIVRTIKISTMNYENYYRVRNACNFISFNKFEGVYTVVTKGAVYILNLATDNYQNVRIASSFYDNGYFYFQNSIYSTDGNSMQLMQIN